MTTNPIIFETQEGRLDLTATVMKVGQDVVVVIFGGERPHIGAVALAQARQSLKNPEKTSATASVLSILGHKEDVIVKSVSERLAAVANCAVVVTAGIHWDSIEESDLQQILRNVETLIQMIEPYLRTSLLKVGGASSLSGVSEEVFVE
jgi:hypothetical protein